MGARNGHLEIFRVDGGIDISSLPSVGRSRMYGILHFYLIPRKDDMGF